VWKTGLRLILGSALAASTVSTAEEKKAELAAHKSINTFPNCNIVPGNVVRRMHCCRRDNVMAQADDALPCSRAFA
jgi:hypothetical protein